MSCAQTLRPEVRSSPAVQWVLKLQVGSQPCLPARPPASCPPGRPPALPACCRCGSLPAPRAHRGRQPRLPGAEFPRASDPPPSPSSPLHPPTRSVRLLPMPGSSSLRWSTRHPTSSPAWHISTSHWCAYTFVCMCVGGGFQLSTHRVAARAAPPGGGTQRGPTAACWQRHAATQPAYVPPGAACRQVRKRALRVLAETLSPASSRPAAVELASLQVRKAPRTSSAGARPWRLPAPADQCPLAALPFSGGLGTSKCLWRRPARPRIHPHSHAHPRSHAPPDHAADGLC
jgi:hypothetical protein